MSDLDEGQREQLKFLLADFGAIKAEIARRSTLQRVVLLAQLAVLAVVLRQAADHALTSLWVAGTWASAALALQFYAREGLEIGRLGRIISKTIVRVASELTDAPSDRLLPSETDPEAAPETRERRSAYNREFMWGVFFGIPLLVTVLFIVHRWDRLEGLVQITTLTPWAILVLVLVIRVVVLLKREV